MNILEFPLIHPLEGKGREMEPRATFLIEMPEDAKILSVGSQDDGYGEQHFMVWALVLTDNPKTERVIEVYATGQEMLLVGRTFIGTVQTHLGLVWHVFDVGETR